MINRYFLTAGRLVNDVAVDVGLDASIDPYGVQDKQFVQLVRQLNIAVEEVAEVHPWEVFKREYAFVTDELTFPTGRYPLPTDFHYMVQQTMWDRAENNPVSGPVSSQQWQYLLGRDMANSTMFGSFRQQEGVLQLWPVPPSDGITIAYEYASTNWFQAGNGIDFKREATAQDDVILLPPSLIRGYLKSKWLASKGFQTTDAVEAVSLFLSTGAGKDAGAPILTMGRTRGGHQFINPYTNVGDTGYGT